MICSTPSVVFVSKRAAREGKYLPQYGVNVGWRMHAPVLSMSLLIATRLQLCLRLELGSVHDSEWQTYVGITGIDGGASPHLHSKVPARMTPAVALRAFPAALRMDLGPGQVRRHCGGPIKQHRFIRSTCTCSGGESLPSGSIQTPGALALPGCPTNVSPRSRSGRQVSPATQGHQAARPLWIRTLSNESVSLSMKVGGASPPVTYQAPHQCELIAPPQLVPP